MTSTTWTLSNAGNPWHDTSFEGNLATHKTNFDQNNQCPACMIGKVYQEIRPRSPEHAQWPIERVYMDIMSSSVKSIEGHNYALIITDDVSMFR